MDYPKISIITPSYNQANFLEDTIKNVIGQNYPNLEYIIIDGGSTDGSIEIIKKYKKHITYWISEKDNGQYNALNKGFEIGTGEIMGWINSDDILLPNSLFVIGNIFRTFPEVNWITSICKIVINKYGHIINCYYHWQGFSKIGFERGENLAVKNVRHYGFIQQESTFWRRNLWEKAGGYINESFEFAADFELWKRFFQYEILYGICAPLGCFRYHGDQKSIVNFDKYIKECFSLLTRRNYTGFEFWIKNKCSNLIPDSIKKKFPNIFQQRWFIRHDEKKLKFKKYSKII